MNNEIWNKTIWYHQNYLDYGLIYLQWSITWRKSISTLLKIDKIIDLLKGTFYKSKWWNESRAKEKSFDFMIYVYVLFLTTNYILKLFQGTHYEFDMLDFLHQHMIRFLDVFENVHFWNGQLFRITIKATDKK